MIKINLLPPNIFEARVIKKLIALFVVIAIAIAGAAFAYTMQINKQTEEMKLQADEVQRLSEQAKNIEGQAASARSGVAPIEQKRKFFEAVWEYNKLYPDLYEDLARFTYAKALYSQIAPSGTALQVQCFVPSLSDAGRYLLNMYRATHMFSSVTISAVPGYPLEGSQPGVGGMMPPMGFPGMPSMPGSMPGFMPPPPGMGPMPGMPGGTTYGGLEAIETGVERAEKPKGFSFTVNCALVKPIMAPTYGPAGGQMAGGMGMPGGPPGMPGMAPGMPGMPGAGAPAAPAEPATPAAAAEEET